MAVCLIKTKHLPTIDPMPQIFAELWAEHGKAIHLAQAEAGRAAEELRWWLNP